MLDIRLIRRDLAGVKAALARRGEDGGDLDRIVALDARARELGGQRDELRSQVRALSKQVGTLRRDGELDRAEAVAGESRALGEREQALAAEAEEVTAEVRTLLLRTPNLPADDCPDGLGENDNVVLRTEGYDAGRYGPHQRVPHWEIGIELGLLDLERAVKLSGSMFVMFRGAGARLVRALTALALDRHADAYEEVRPPSLVLTGTMTATGHLPKFADEAYHLERDDLWAVPTAEVPLTSLARDEILDEADLPMRFTAYSACYRREAGSAGRDTRGLLRSHEFDKVELFAYATPGQAAEVHADVLARAEALLRDLGLAYRVVDLCTGDLGFASARTWDLEVYAPGCDQWLEVSSVSWYRDFQARRANVRYRPAGGGSTEVVHTVNGSALAWPRVWAALVETGRQADGSVALPDVVQPYLGGRTQLG